MFQEPIKLRMNCAIIAGFASGMIKEVNCRQYPAPSIFAASRIDVGKPYRYWRTKNAVRIAPKQPGTISARPLSVHPIVEYTQNCAIIVEGNGTIMAARQ